MNISGIVIKCLPEHEKEIISIIKKTDFCEYHIHENGKIIVTIEGQDVGEEIGKLQKIQTIPHVIAADMVYSYCENELDDERENLLSSPDFPDWLNDETISAENIKYSGDINL